MKTYINSLNVGEVSLGIEQLLIAPFPQSTWIAAPGRVDVGNPPTGFYSLGAVVEDSFVFKANRTKFVIETGIPQIRQYEQVMKIEGSIEARLHSKDWSKIQYMLGNYSIAAPSSGAVVRQPVGTSVIEYFTVMGVCDFIDGTQVIHYIYKCVPAEEFEEAIKGASENPRPLAKFNAFGVVSTLFTSTGDLIVAERIFVPSTS